MPYKYGTYGQLGETLAQMGVSTDTTPIYIGVAPINLVRGYADAGLVNTPVKLRSLADCQTKIGYSPDWETYSLCEAMAAHYDNTNGAVGPIYVINVMDPDVHRSVAEQQVTLTFINGKAEIKGSDMILDSVKIPRPVPEDISSLPVQSVEWRGKGTGKDDKGFDYAKAYAAAGLKIEDGTIIYEPTGEIDPHLIRKEDGRAYAGILLKKPAGATKVTVKINGDVADENLDLTHEGPFVSGGELIEYIWFADADGTPRGNDRFAIECDWEGGETPKTGAIVATENGAYFEEDVDYLLTYSVARGAVVIEDLSGEMPTIVTVRYHTVDTSEIGTADIIGETTADGKCSGIAAIKLLFMEQGAIANILSAPGWDDDPLVYRALVQASKQMNGHWDSVIYVDMPLVEDGEPVDTIEKAIRWKRDNRYEDERAKVFWPQVIDDAGRICHIAPLAVAETMRLDQSHDGVPFETCGNKAIPMVRQYFGAESTNSGFDQTDAAELTQKGITTVAPWASHWQLWGDHTAAYEYGDDYVDPRSIFDVSIRMLLYITNSFQRQWANEIDRPMTRALKDTILNYEQEKLDTLVSQGALLPGATVVFSEDENSTDDMMNGDFKWSIAVTPTPPLKSATVTVSYTDAGFAAYFEEE